jgi:hypothetical protein
MPFKCQYCDFQGSCDDHLYHHIGDKHRNIEIRNAKVFEGIFANVWIPQRFMMWVIGWTKSVLRYI